MTDINIREHEETFTDTIKRTTTPTPPPVVKICDSNLKEFLSQIRKDHHSININEMPPLIALSLLDFLVIHLMEDELESVNTTKEKFNPHEDPVISRLLFKGLEGNFSELPCVSKKRHREPDSHSPDPNHVNLVYDSPKHKKLNETPLASLPHSSSSSTSNTVPSSPGYIHTKQNELLTKRFMLKTPPALNSTEYLDRIHQYCHFSTAVYLSSAYYIYKLVVELKLLKVDKLNVHRLLITAVRIACKVVEDMKHRQEFIGKIGGLNMEDLLALEISFLFLIKFECQVNQDLMTSLVIYIRDTYAN